MRSGARSANSQGAWLATARGGTQAGALEGCSASALALVSAEAGLEPSPAAIAARGPSGVPACASADACGGDAQQAIQDANMTRVNVREAALMVRALSSRGGEAVNGNPPPRRGERRASLPKTQICPAPPPGGRPSGPGHYRAAAVKPSMGTRRPAAGSAAPPC